MSRPSTYFYTDPEEPTLPLGIDPSTGRPVFTSEDEMNVRPAPLILPIALDSSLSPFDLGDFALTYGKVREITSIILSLSDPEHAELPLWEARRVALESSIHTI